MTPLGSPASRTRGVEPLHRVWSATPGGRIGGVGLALLLGMGARAQAEGLRLSVQAGWSRYAAPAGRSADPVDLLMVQSALRVSRGRAGMTFGVPLLHTAGTVAAADERVILQGGGSTGPGRTGLGDMNMALDYNLLQDRARRLIVTSTGSVRFATAAAGFGNGETVGGLGLSVAWGISPKWVAYAEARQSWRGVLAPLATQWRSADVGAVYWWTEKVGVSVGASAADYGRGLAPALDTSAGLVFEALPGLMLNLSSQLGLTSTAPLGGLGLGTSIEL